VLHWQEVLEVPQRLAVQGVPRTQVGMASVLQAWVQGRMVWALQRRSRTREV
jgi:hypothetical protein